MQKTITLYRPGFERHTLHNGTILVHPGLEDISIAANFQRWCRKNDIPQKISLAMFIADHKLLKHYYPTKEKCLEAIGDIWGKLPKHIEL